MKVKFNLIQLINQSMKSKTSKTTGEIIQCNHSQLCLNYSIKETSSKMFNNYLTGIVHYKVLVTLLSITCLQNSNALVSTKCHS